MKLKARISNEKHEGRNGPLRDLSMVWCLKGVGHETPLPKS